jgi:hypothetical protein
MKYGYKCKCGWELKRGDLTRKKYAAAKREHAYPADEKEGGCKLLQKELELTNARPEGR